ncbi:F-box protein At5g07610-like [Papaver somniferum]|uniref:F-box protein At5g07610-like n=1 Tax=Papaver somniferum TaxID=3469 RepID=UPI000E6F9353|nr:F-box protein At5g07610-like [Papaver somniferum]
MLPESSSLSFATLVNNIDILQQILLRLPLKSLFLFKSVSKQWFSLISDPYFVHCYSLQRRLSVRGLFLHKNSFTSNPEFEFIRLTSDDCFSYNTMSALLDDLSCLRIEQSCNGLLCCRDYKQMSEYRSYTYYIYNPSIKHYKVLPMSNYLPKDRSFSVASVGLAFDPIKSPYYQVVRVLRYSGAEGFYQIEIYNSKTSSWRLSGDVFSKPDDLTFYKSGVYWNGLLHWISSSTEYLGCFDVGGEVLKKISVPPMISGKGRGKRKVIYFGEYKGHLHLIFEYDITSTPCFDILEMDTDYKCWNIKYHVNLEALASAYPEKRDSDSDEDIVDDDGEEPDGLPYCFSILLVRDGVEEESPNLIIHVPEKVICYDLKDTSFEEIQDISPSFLGGLQYQWFNAYQYIESLASVS